MFLIFEIFPTTDNSQFTVLYGTMCVYQVTGLVSECSSFCVWCSRRSGSGLASSSNVSNDMQCINIMNEYMYSTCTFRCFFRHTLLHICHIETPI